jgi:glycosyltransferase involved in cell wall biosynthesis
MASGTPVVTSNVSSLPEVTGDAALLVDPYDPQSIADAIRRVITDQALSQDLRRKGLARARQFSWETSVRRIRDIYRDVASVPNVAAAPAQSAGRETGGAPPR